MKGTIVIMNVGSAALQDLAVCCFHQITGMVFGGCSFFLIADRIKNSIGWSVSDISVCNMTIYDVDDGMFRLRSFRSWITTSQSGPNWEARSAAICFNTVSRPIWFPPINITFKWIITESGGTSIVWAVTVIRLWACSKADKFIRQNVQCRHMETAHFFIFYHKKKGNKKEPKKNKMWIP